MHSVDIGNAGVTGTGKRWLDNLRQKDQRIIEEVVGHVNSLDPNNKKNMDVATFKALYKKIQDFAGNEETVGQIIKEKGSRHAHFFARTLFVDDVPFDLLETKDGDLLPLSEFYNDIKGGGRDSYRRIWNDTASGSTANQAFTEAIESVDLETMLKKLAEGASAMNNYAGKAAGLEMAYGVAGGWLKCAQADTLAQFLGIHDKLPLPTSDLERWFGQGAPALGKEDVWKATEKLKMVFGDLTKEFPAVGKVESRMRQNLGIQQWKLWLIRSQSIALVVAMALITQMMKQMEADTKE
jgi:hypothetical protein